MFWESLASASTFTPVAATKIAEQIDRLYGFLLICSLIACLLVIGGLVYFVIKYRRKTANDKTAYISHNATLEFAWSFIPFVIFMVFFAWGWWLYYKLRTMPEDALEIHIAAQKWNWSFVYKNGRTTSGDLYVPLNEPVKLIMSSNDVIHSFYIPAFRNKQDVVPGRYTWMSFQATKLGDFHVFCTEYCGDGHSSMLAKVHVLPREKFDEWLANDPYKGLSLAQVGEKVFTSRCLACHNSTADRKVGPGFKGIFGKDEAMSDGKTVKVDENYIRESILNPQAKIVKGFEGVLMTSFQGQLVEQEILGVIEYIKSLK